MNLTRIFSKNGYRYLCIILISICIAGVSASLMGENVWEAIKDYQNASGESIIQKQYECGEIQPINYLVNGNCYTSQNNDPQLIISEVDTYISSVNIMFAKPLDQNISVQIYWGIEGEGFVPQRVKDAVAYTGSQNIKIRIDEKVTDLRLDIGSAENVSFSLSQVVLNPDTLFQCLKESLHHRIWFDRFQIIFLFAVFILLHFVADVRKMYHVLFDKRWIAAGILLVFLVANNYNGDSIACFDMYVQNGDGSEYVLPVIGKERSIRSDEWLNATPVELSTQYLQNPYGKYNNLLRATDTVNPDALTVMSILNPVSLGQMIIKAALGYDYAHSFKWYAFF